MDSTCPMCWLSMPSDVLNQHIGSAHKEEPNFIVRCDFPGCTKTYDVWKSYRQHSWRTHNRNIRDLNDIKGLSSSESDSDDDNDDFEHFDDEDLVEGALPVIPQAPAFENLQHPGNMIAPEKLKYQTALFVASMKEKLLVPQTTLDTIVEGTCKLIEEYLQITQDALIGDDTAESIPADAVKEASGNCKPSTIFNQCTTPHQIKSFMTESLNRVAPEKVTMGMLLKWSKAGQLVNQDYFAYMPPFMQSLQLCLNNPDILHCVGNLLPHEDGTLTSVLDEHYYRTHNVFIDDPKALVLEIYEDDVEITSALSNRTHKLSMFYWSLLHIYPQFRPSHRSHNLLAITTSENLKRFGAQPILDDFLKAMKQLGTPEGVKLKVGNEERVFHGLLTFVAGDAPASSLLGSFRLL